MQVKPYVLFSMCHANTFYVKFYSNFILVYAFGALTDSCIEVADSVIMKAIASPEHAVWHLCRLFHEDAFNGTSCNAASCD